MPVSGSGRVRPPTGPNAVGDHERHLDLIVTSSVLNAAWQASGNFISSAKGSYLVYIWDTTGLEWRVIRVRSGLARLQLMMIDDYASSSSDL